MKLNLDTPPEKFSKNSTQKVNVRKLLQKANNTFCLQKSVSMNERFYGTCKETLFVIGLKAGPLLQLKPDNRK